MGIKETMMGFADKVTSTVDKGVKTGKDGVKRMAEKNALKKEMAQLGTDVNNTLIAIGRKLYNESPDDERFAMEFEVLKAKEEEIERIKLEIQRLDGTTSCKSCGESIPKEAATCPNCGASTAGTADAFVSTEPAAEAAPVEAEVMKPCPNCGTMFEADAKFCSNCGSKL